MHGKVISAPLGWSDTVVFRPVVNIPVGQLVELVQQAWESACGYWIDELGEASNKRRKFADSGDPDFAYTYEFTVADPDEQVKDGVKSWTVNIATVRAGIERIVATGGGVRSDLVAQVALALAQQGSSDPVWDIDDDACDVIVQVGLFGEVIFG